MLITRPVLLVIVPFILSFGLMCAAQLAFLEGSLHRDLGMGRVAEAVSLDNYQRFFGDPFFLLVLWTTVKVSALAALATLALGYPVALKIQSRAIAHKTEMGGVRLNLADAAAVREAFARIIESARFGAPFASIDGVLVQRMAPPGLEAIAGIVVDPTFGPILTVGLGGIHTEIFKDVVSAPAPLGEDEALALVRRLKSWPLFAGVRGRGPADALALARTVAGLSRFAAEMADHLAEIDLNPILVHPEGQGVSVADALIVTAGSAVKSCIGGSAAAAGFIGPAGIEASAQTPKGVPTRQPRARPLIARQ